MLIVTLFLIDAVNLLAQTEQGCCKITS